jgi:hypothetical protein
MCGKSTIRRKENLKTETGITNNTYHSFLLAYSKRDVIRELKKTSPDTWNRNRLPFSLNRFIPTPISLLLLDGYSSKRDSELDLRVFKETGFWNKHAWQTHHWGVADDVTDVFERGNDKNYWAIKFNTTGCPPTPAIERLSEAYPMVHFCHKYFGTETSVAGHKVYVNGIQMNGKTYTDKAYANYVSDFQRKGLSITNGTVNMVVNYSDQIQNGGTTDVFSAVFYEYCL